MATCRRRPTPCVGRRPGAAPSRCRSAQRCSFRRGCSALRRTGLADAAAAVGRVAAGEGTRTPPRGHLTLARGRRRLPAELTGVPVASRWLVEEFCLVSSVLDRRGARYETVARAPLDP